MNQNEIYVHTFFCIDITLPINVIFMLFGQLVSSHLLTSLPSASSLVSCLIASVTLMSPSYDHLCPNFLMTNDKAVTISCAHITGGGGIGDF